MRCPPTGHHGHKIHDIDIPTHCLHIAHPFSKRTQCSIDYSQMLYMVRIDYMLKLWSQPPDRCLKHVTLDSKAAIFHHATRLRAYTFKLSEIQNETKINAMIELALYSGTQRLPSIHELFSTPHNMYKPSSSSSSWSSSQW